MEEEGVRMDDGCCDDRFLHTAVRISRGDDTVRYRHGNTDRSACGNADRNLDAGNTYGNDISATNFVGE